MLPFPHTHAFEEMEASIGLPITPVREIPLGTISKTALVPDYQVPAGTS